ncbi:MAG: hypothetical protein FWF60_02760 [Oscillospiraceae bacterium]|nr:hypothetical protein [Oscillospiraceae bacterium]
MDERSAVIKIGGQDYELLLSTRATKVIAKRYGGLEQLGDKLLKAENFELALDEFIFIITLLANQPIAIYNLWHQENPKPYLTEEMVELLTTPLDLASYKNAITEAMMRGTARNVVSADDGDTKNAVAS